MIHDIADENWMLKENIELGLKHLIKNNLTFDALVRPNHLKNLYVFAKKYNNLPIVIDHIAKPKILNQEIDEWKSDMKQLSKLDNIFCKYCNDPPLLEESPLINIFIKYCLFSRWIIFC